MSTISPSPWKAERLEGRYWVSDANGKRFARIIATPHAAADARLIEKAPAMRDLLKRIVNLPEVTDAALLQSAADILIEIEGR